jgi:hypothetical protein
MCVNPCIPTPKEARKLLKLGYKLESKYFNSKETEDDVRVLLPMEAFSGSCIYLDENCLCTLHDKGLKPLEGRLSLHGMNYKNAPHEAMLDLWNSKEGTRAIKFYEKKPENK